jgi:biopolymer transport protein ExbD
MTTRKHRPHDKPVKVEIPITAMLDMSFQMLIFFIMNFNPSDFEGQMDMALPAKVENVSKEKENPDPKPSDAEEDTKLPADLTVVVRTANDGTNNGIISQIVVRDKSGDTVIPNLDALTTHLDKAKDALSNKDDIKIEGDSQLKWLEVIKVMDACHKAGFTTGFGPPPDLPGAGGG